MISCLQLVLYRQAHHKILLHNFHSLLYNYEMCLTFTVMSFSGIMLACVATLILYSISWLMEPGVRQIRLMVNVVCMEH
jgi:hypothetical protein